MSKFIRLNDLQLKSPVYISMDHVCTMSRWIEPDPAAHYTIVALENGRQYYVRETPEDILEFSGLSLSEVPSQ